jgi:crotonobetainyl-CoA hydratase
MTASVQTHSEGGVLTITLNRPKANAINVATSQALYAAFAMLEQDPTLRVAILTGTGRFFSAGWDLNAATEGEAINANHGPGGFGGITEYFSLNKPVIAAVNGLAMGGGFEIALACDLIVACEGAEFALPEVKLGMIADSGGVLRLPRRLPHAIASEMLLTGRRMGAGEARQWGLVNQVTPADQLLNCAQALARQIVEAAPLAIAAVKEVMRETQGQSLIESYSLLRSGTLAQYQAMLGSEDAQEGPVAFGEKRPPRWMGR